MSLQIEHFGLYFARNQVELARKEREKVQHLQAAWDWLENKKEAVSPLGTAIEAGFRYRFLEDEAAAVKGWEFLQNISLETIRETVTAAHLTEMLRPYVSQAWLEHFAELSGKHLARYDEADAFDKLWLITLSLVSGVVLEEESRIQRGVELFQKAVDEQIHPEGFLKPLVEGAKEAAAVFNQMLLGLGALSLAAEAAEHLGLKLWQYEKRDVGLNTAASYLVYYYFYPNKWRWGAGLTETDTHAAFKEHGAFMEMLTSHVNPRGVELLMDEQRPFFSPSLGGLTSLSHYQTAKRKRGFFG